MKSNLTIVSDATKQELHQLFEDKKYTEFITRIKAIKLAQPQKPKNKFAGLVKQLKHGLNNDLIQHMSMLNYWHKLCNLICK